MVSFPQILPSPLIFPLTLLTTIPLLILLAISQSLFRWHHIFQKKYPPDLCCTLLDVYKLFSSKDTLTRRTGWSLFLAAYSLFLVDLFLWRFPQPEMAPPLLQVEQVGSDTIKVIIWALSTNLNLSVTGGTAYLEAGSWSRQPEKGDCLAVQNCYCVLPCWLIVAVKLLITFPIIKPRKQDQC